MTVVALQISLLYPEYGVSVLSLNLNENATPVSHSVLRISSNVGQSIRVDSGSGVIPANPQVFDEMPQRALGTRFRPKDARCARRPHTG